MPTKKRGSRVIFASAALLAIGFFALLVIVATTFNLAKRSQSDLETSLSTQELSSTALQLRYGLLAAESSQRGYIATGNEIYLAPYATAKASATRHLQLIIDRLEPNQRNSAATQRLIVLVNAKFQEMDATISFKRDRRDAASLDILRSNRGKALMDEANVFISSIVRNADSRLTAIATVQKEGLFRLNRTNFALAILILLVVATTFAIFIAFIRHLGRARDEVAILNSDLERRVEDRTLELSAARDRAEMLLAEVNHRVANSLAIVASMVAMQARAAASEETRTALTETRSRISAVALVHKKLYTSGEVETVALEEFLQSLLEQLEVSMRDAGHTASIKTDIAPLSLATDKTVSLGVIASEWVTNAFKYAYPNGKGEIRVALKRESDGQAVLLVEDDGVGRKPGQQPQGTGLGTKLVNAMATTLGGQVEYVERKPGTSARLIMPTV